MSYKSPIEVITEETTLSMEDNIVKAVQKYGINVNKIELQKALMYDRKQYTQGFEDGRKYEQEERGHGHWVNDRLLSINGWTYEVHICSLCGMAYQDISYEFNYCPHCGAKMDERREDANE